MEKRTILGRKVKRLRKEGKLPANIYGRRIKSLAVVAERRQVEQLFQQVGETGLVDVKVKGEKKPRHVLFHNPQYDPLTDELIHIDFYQVDLTQKVTTEVPIRLVGKAPAVESGEGVLVQILNEIEVEALPTDLPEHFEVSLEKLKKKDDALLVKDLPVPEGVEIKANPEQVVAKIEEPVKEKEEEEKETTEEEKPTEEAQEQPQAEEKKEEAPAGEEKQAEKENPNP